MLSYVFRNLNSIGDAYLNNEEFDNIQDLFARILYLGISNQIKRGIYKEYEEQQENLNCLKGKINISESISTMSLINKKLVCEFDEYSENNLFNQILKTTCLLLIRKGSLKLTNKKALKNILLYFSNVDEINLKEVKWKQLSFHRNNLTYKMLLNICYLVANGLLQTTEGGNLRLTNYLDDQTLHKIYEKFILEFYRTEYKEFNANPSYIKWDVCTDDHLEFLPNMQSDIMLTYERKCLIIDAKFYSHTMQTQYEKKSFISGNLYQIFTYVKNKEADENFDEVAGMLLYAKTNEDVTPDNDYIISNNKISVKTLDLNNKWDLIKKQLDNVVQNFK